MPAENYGTDSDNAVKTIQYYYGGHDNDTAGGTALADELYGGQGNDILMGGAWGISGTGPDAGSASNPLLHNFFLPTGNDYLDGGTGADAVHGFDGDDEIYGGGGDDSGVNPARDGKFYSIDGKVGQGLFGGDGDDYVNGGTGNDAVYGGAGNDDLIGSDGRDIIDGGADRDRMLGGSDGDTFVFTALADLAGDRIMDFARGDDDVIDVSAIDAKPGGINNKFKYIGDDSFTGKGQISFDNGKLRFNTDHDNRAEAVMQVNADRLSRGDFEL